MPAMKNSPCWTTCATRPGIISVKDGCSGQGACGACLVELNGTSGPLLRHADEESRRRQGHHPGGSARRTAPHAGQRLRRKGRRAVRLLLSRLPDAHQDPAAGKSPSQPPGNPGSPETEPVPLHGLRQDRGSHRACRHGAGRGKGRRGRPQPGHRRPPGKIRGLGDGDSAAGPSSPTCASPAWSTAP